ncbi:MAG: Peptidoglycan-associated lipoprotein [Deltaproteobacteria bacterium]|jgi:outer membrane protein OmpA-like peptidoglycan-associated protein|nr:Peptidoglycan-associated lipoprotein [Deltaproteobacteria bacterium]
MKIVAVYFVFLPLFLIGCAATSPEPPAEVEEKKEEVTEEIKEEIKEVLDEAQKDLEHKKKIEEQEKQQEQILKELLKEEAAAEAEETETSAAADESQLAAKTDESASEDLEHEPQKVEVGSAVNTSEEKSQDTSQQAEEEEPQQPSQQPSQQVSTEETSQVASQETVQQTEESVPQQESEEQLPKKTAVIASAQQEPEQLMFMPESPLALSSAKKLVACSKVPETMEAIYQRLQKTKDLIIADRRLRDRKNDRLMPVVHFDFDQTKIKPDYRKLLTQQSSCVMRALETRGDMIFQIEGHADERGSDEYNMALGHRRANSIANAIMAYLSNPELTRIISYGEEFPLVRHSSKSAWAKNRRVEFTLLLKQ